MRNYVKSLFTPTALRQLIKVGLVGIVNTVVSFALFNVFLKVFRGTKALDEGFNWGQTWAIALSFLIATFVSYALNRRWTFELGEGGDRRRETMHFFAINLGAMGVAQLVVNSADWFWGPLSLLEQNLFYLLAAVLIIVPKFAGYRDIVFGKAPRADEPTPVAVSDR